MPGRKSLLFLILASAFLIRAILGFSVHGDLKANRRQFLIAGDAAGYWELGTRLAEGKSFEIYQPPRRVMRMPGFPLCLALAIRLTPDKFDPLMMARLVLAGTGTVACWLVYELGKVVFDQQIGLTAAAFTSLSPTMSGFSVLILSETLFAACLLLNLLVIAKLVQHERNRSGRGGRPSAWVGLSVLAGLTAAVACYVRPSWLLAGPLLTGLALFFCRTARSPTGELAESSPDAKTCRRRALVSGLVVLLILVAALAPWGFRNYQVVGKFVLTTLWLGPSLYDGLNPHATGDSNMGFLETDPAIAELTEVEVDTYYRRRAWEYARAHPQHVLILAVAKFQRFWKPWPNAQQFSNIWLNLAVSVFCLPIAFLAIWGCWSTRNQVSSWALTVGPVLYFCVVHMVFVGSLRYRLPAEYPLCIMSAAGFHGLRSWLTGRSTSNTSETRRSDASESDTSSVSEDRE